jgi:hypothetical protein
MSLRNAVLTPDAAGSLHSTAALVGGIVGLVNLVMTLRGHIRVSTGKAFTSLN